MLTFDYEVSASTVNTSFLFYFLACFLNLTQQDPAKVLAGVITLVFSYDTRYWKSPYELIIPRFRVGFDFSIGTQRYFWNLIMRFLWVQSVISSSVFFIFKLASGIWHNVNDISQKSFCQIKNVLIFPYPENFQK